MLFGRLPRILTNSLDSYESHTIWHLPLQKALVVARTSTREFANHVKHLLDSPIANQERHASTKPVSPRVSEVSCPTRSVGVLKPARTGSVGRHAGSAVT